MPSPRLHITPYGAGSKPLHPVISAARVHVEVGPVGLYGRYHAYELFVDGDGVPKLRFKGEPMADDTGMDGC